MTRVTAPHPIAGFVVTQLFSGTENEVADPLLERLRQATLGSYDIAGELGRGGMAVVYVGKDLKLQRTVAIKVMDPRLSLSPGMADRFLQEARIAARLQHPNIIVVHDIRQADDLIFFVMGLVQGGALDELNRAPTPLPIEQARWMMLQAARALAHAHAEGIVHRDVKPANILLNLKGDVVLTDFGIARAVDGNGMTKSGTQIGTPLYMSPEQFADRPAGPASDQYSLGITAYQLIAGQPPFKGELYQLIAAHATQIPVPLRQLRQDCPAFLSNAIMRMLDKEPANRFPSLDDVADVFGVGLPLDGGAARKQLALTAAELQRHRFATVAALSAKTPISPVPTIGGSVPAGATPRPRSVLVTISPPGATLFSGSTLQLRASAASDDGETLADAPVTWTSSDSSVLTVRQDGTVVGSAAGTASVRATIQGAWAEATIHVDLAPIARLLVDTPTLTLRVGDVARPVVTAIDVNGTTRSDVSLSWISRASSVAVMEAPGVIRAVAPGHAELEVSTANLRRYVDVKVTRREAARVRILPAPRTMELGSAMSLNVEVFDDLDNRLPSTSVRWSSSAGNCVHVDSAGTVLAVGSGIATISAAVDGVEASIELEAVEAPVGSLQLTAPESRLEVGDELAIALQVLDPAGGSRSTAGVIVWSSAPHIVAFDAERMFARALSVGTASIRARAVDASTGVAVEASLELAVAATAITRIEVIPSQLDLEMGAVCNVAVRCLDRRGRIVPQAVCEWYSEAPDVASVESATVRGLAIGSTNVHVRALNEICDAVTVCVPVRVHRAAIARLQIESRSDSVRVGESLQLRVLAWNSTGASELEVRPSWRVNDERIASVDERGCVYAKQMGRVTIIAEADAAHAERTLHVAAAAIATATIRIDGNVLTGVACSLSIDARDARGNAMTPLVRWSVEPASAATIERGVLVARQSGRLTVRAMLMTRGERGDEVPAAGLHDVTTVVEARLPRVESLFAEPSKTVIKVGQRSRVKVSTVVEGGAVISAPEVRWRSSDEAVALVDGTGEILGVAGGVATITAIVGDLEHVLSVTVRAPREFPFKRRSLLLIALLPILVAVAWLVVKNFWVGDVGMKETVKQDTTAAAAAAIRAQAAHDSVEAAKRARIIDDGARKADSTAKAKRAVVIADSLKRDRAKRDSIRLHGTNAQKDSVARAARIADSLRQVARRDSVRSDSIAKAIERENARADSLRLAAIASKRTDSIERARRDSAARVVANSESLSQTDIDQAVDAVVAQLNARTISNADLASFFKLGDGHTIKRKGAPQAQRNADGKTVVRFEILLSKKLAGGTRKESSAQVSLVLTGGRGAATRESVNVTAFK